MKTYELPKKATCKVNTEKWEITVAYHKMDGAYWYFTTKENEVINIRCSAERDNKNWFYYLK